MAQDIGVTCLLGGDLCCYQCAPLLSPTGYKAKKRLLTSLLGPISYHTNMFYYHGTDIVWSLWHLLSPSRQRCNVSAPLFINRLSESLLCRAFLPLSIPSVLPWRVRYWISTIHNNWLRILFQSGRKEQVVGPNYCKSTWKRTNFATSILLFSWTAILFFRCRYRSIDLLCVWMVARRCIPKIHAKHVILTFCLPFNIHSLYLVYSWEKDTLSGTHACTPVEVYNVFKRTPVIHIPSSV